MLAHGVWEAEEDLLTPGRTVTTAGISPDFPSGYPTPPHQHQRPGAERDRVHGHCCHKFITERGPREQPSGGGGRTGYLSCSNLGDNPSLQQEGNSPVPLVLGPSSKHWKVTARSWKEGDGRMPFPALLCMPPPRRRLAAHLGHDCKPTDGKVCTWQMKEAASATTSRPHRGGLEATALAGEMVRPPRPEACWKAHHCRNVWPPSHKGTAECQGQTTTSPRSVAWHTQGDYTRDTLSFRSQ